MIPLKCVGYVPFPRKEVFELLTDPSYLPLLLQDKIDMEWIDEKNQTEENPEYTFVMTRFGISHKVRWKVLQVIKEQKLVYYQSKGIYPKWKHTLLFLEEGPQQTKVIDEIDYTLPFGPPWSHRQ